MAKILIIDDDPVYRSKLALALKNILPLYTEFFEAFEGSVGLEKLRTHPDIQLVITDCSMPGTDGLEFIRQARKQGSKIPIILLGINNDNLFQAIQAGANLALLKRPNPIQRIVSAALQLIPVQ